MPIKLITPLQQTFPLTKSDEVLGDPSDPTMVTIRQASTRFRDSREDMVAALFRETRRLNIADNLNDLIATIKDERKIRFEPSDTQRQLDFVLDTLGEIVAHGPNGNNLEIVPWTRLRMLTVMNTLVDCNATNSKGKPVFKFKNGQLDMSEAEFRIVWDNLPPIMSEELYELSLEVNPPWKAKVKDDDGEDVSGEAGSGES